MSMYPKKNPMDEERESLAGFFAFICFVCMCITPVLLFVGLVGPAPQLLQSGVYTGVLAMITGAIVRVITPEEYKK